MVDMKELGKNIRATRKMKGLTQEELAKKTDLSTMSIRRYEAGERVITEGTLQRIAAALNVEWLELVPEGQRAGMVIEHIRKKLRDEKPVTPKDRVEAAFERLSPEGQQAAAERLEELALLEKYQKKEPSDGS